jgi:hypothetical protein
VFGLIALSAAGCTQWPDATALTTTPVRECASDYCTPSIPGPVTVWPWSDQTGYLRMSATNITLRRLDGSAVWTVKLDSATQEPDLVGTGDFTGDGVPDFIFDETRPASPPQYCSGHAMSVTQLVFVDGDTGTTWRPVPASTDLCWPSFGYATHQWGVGSAYIGHFLANSSTNQVLVFPYYATYGVVLSYVARVGWRQASGATNALVYPSTPLFDSFYNRTNSTPCEAASGQDQCFVQYSHVPNGVFLSSGGTTTGLFVLTSARALIYRPDLTPTSDTVSTYAEGSGRNYGLVEEHDLGGLQMVTLVGGCSVAKTRDTMRLRTLSEDPCGLQHHYEFYLVKGQSIVQHDGRFFGWAGTTDIWQNRLEFPFPSDVPLTGGSLWSVFNLYRNGEWRTMLLPNPADPDHAIEVPGWYVWGAVSDRAGHVLLAATRTKSTSSTDVVSYIPPWEFDYLTWRNGGLVSVGHYAGVVPSLVLYPPGPSYHVSDGDTFGLIEKQPPHGGPNVLLVEAPDGAQSTISVPEQR